jgi:IEC3 subunit of the Ino80 complex, chromatin re-modelling
MALTRKKYRKMRIKFEEKMNLSNQLFKEEQDAAETARRLALENEFVKVSMKSRMQLLIGLIANYSTSSWM